MVAFTYQLYLTNYHLKTYVTHSYMFNLWINYENILELHDCTKIILLQISDPSP